MEAQTTVSNSTQCGLFISEYKKYTVSGVAFSFKHDVYLHVCGGVLTTSKKTKQIRFALPNACSRSSLKLPVQ